jgi:hypothetical protein
MQIPQGFRFESTSGGCTALHCWIDEASETYQLITREDAYGMPIAPHNDACGPIMLSYHVEGQLTYYREFPNMPALCAWMDNAEYVLPENGDGPEVNGWTRNV